MLQVVELPPVEMVSNGSISAQDIKACDEKVDIWALGVTLFELLTGASSFLSFQACYGRAWSRFWAEHSSWLPTPCSQLLTINKLAVEVHLMF